MWASLPYLKSIFTTQPSNLHNLISLQTPRSTRSSSIVTISWPPTISSLKITDRSSRYASPRLWNQLPDSFRQPHQPCRDSPPHAFVKSFFTSSSLSASITPTLFHFPLLPLGHVSDVMLVWRKGNINKSLCYSIVYQRNGAQW